MKLANVMTLTLIQKEMLNSDNYSLAFLSVNFFQGYRTLQQNARPAIPALHYHNPLVMTILAQQI
jgi:hypothetical protein